MGGRCALELNARRRVGGYGFLPPSYKGKGLFASGASARVCTPTNHLMLGQSEAYLRERGLFGGHCFSDLDQNPAFGSTPGKVMPAIDTHPCIYSHLYDRLVLPQELLLVQGVDIEGTVLCGKRKPSVLPMLMQQLPTAQQLSLGSGLHPHSSFHHVCIVDIHHLRERGRC